MGRATLLTVRNAQKVSIVVWARGGWRSMPHVTYESFTGKAETGCGREIALGGGVTGIVLTQIRADLFMATGCGLCAATVLADVRREAREARPEARTELRALLQRLEWTVEP